MPMIEEFDYFDGNHTFDFETRELVFVRECGLGSNYVVLLHFLMQLKLQGIYPRKIRTNLVELHGFNLYQDLLYVDADKSEAWQKIPTERVETFLNTVAEPNSYGMGTTRDDIDFDLISPVLDAYFNIQPHVIENADAIARQKKIVCDETVFIWWRRTDKTSEMTWFADWQYPTVQQVIEHIPVNRRVLFQTDDPGVHAAFTRQADVAMESLDVLPLSPYENAGFHHSEISSLTPAQFFAKYATSVEKHFIDLMSLVVVASRCDFFIGYPGNVSLLVALQKRNFDRMVFFKNNKELF